MNNFSSPSPHLNLLNSFEPFQTKQNNLEQNLTNLESKNNLSFNQKEKQINIPLENIHLNIEKLDNLSQKNINSNIIDNKRKSLLPPFQRASALYTNNSELSRSPKHSKKDNKTFENLNSRMEKEKEIKKKTFYDVITNIYLAKKFISILMRVSLIRKPKFLNKTHFTLINDISFFFSSFVNKSKSKQYFKVSTTNLKETKSINFKHRPENKKYLFHYLMKKIVIFNPMHNLVMLTNMINLMIYFFLLFLVPATLSFNIDVSKGDLGINNYDYYCIMLTIFIFYLVDILISINTAYYYKGELMLKRRTIFIYYIKENFLLDIISCFCFLPTLLDFGFITDFYTYFFLSGVLILKTKRIFNIFKQLEEILIIDQTYFNLYELIKLFLRIIIISHFAACLWYMITPSDKAQKSWILEENLIEANWQTKYLYAYYFIIITMNTVGYGDIAPQNPKEIIFIIFFVFLACSLFAYCINCVGNIFTEIYKKESEFRSDLFLINEYMKKKYIHKDLQIRVRKYLEYIWKEEKIQNIELSQRVIKKLSGSLQAELLLEANGPIIGNIDLFSKNFSEKTLKSLIEIMHEERYTPDEIIFENNENIDNFDMFIIKKGKVELYIQNNLNENIKSLMLLKEGKIFGEISFFSEQKRSTCVRSKDFTTLIRINQEKFKEILKESYEDYEKFNHIKDSINFYNNYDSLFIKCYSCNQSNHLITNCPLLHRHFYKDVVLSKYNYSIIQERGKCKRKNKRINALKAKDLNNSDFLRDIYQNNSEYENSEDEDSQISSFEFQNENSEINEPTLKKNNSKIVGSLNFTEVEDLNEKKEEDNIENDTQMPNSSVILPPFDIKNNNSDLSNSPLLKNNNKVFQNKESETENTKIKKKTVKIQNSFIQEKNESSMISNDLKLNRRQSIKEKNEVSANDLKPNFNRRQSIKEKNESELKLNRRQSIKESKDKNFVTFSPETAQNLSKEISTNKFEREKTKKPTNVTNLSNNIKLKSGDDPANNEKDNKDNNNEHIKELLLMDLMKSYTKYFPFNNYENVLRETNRKTLQKLKKKKKAHLFLSEVNPLSRIKSKMEINKNQLRKIESQFNIGFGGGSPAKRVLRKQSEVLKDWKQVLENFRRKESQANKEKQNKLFKILSNFFKKCFH